LSASSSGKVISSLGPSGSSLGADERIQRRHNMRDLIDLDLFGEISGVGQFPDVSRTRGYDRRLALKFAAMVKLLADAQVNFVVIGGYAAMLHGSAFLTQDLDICYERSPENLKRLAAALASSRNLAPARLISIANSKAWLIRSARSVRVSCSKRRFSVRSTPKFLAASILLPGGGLCISSQSRFCSSFVIPAWSFCSLFYSSFSDKG
jgi:hypothetical protein